MPDIVRREVLSSACSLALLIGGCPKRQTSPRIVYVPSPPAAAPGTTAPPQTLVIVEPASPAEPGAAAGEQAPASRPTRPRRRVLRPEPAASAVESAPEAAEPPAAAPVPALEPRESSAEESALRRQILELQEDVRQRLTRLDTARLASAVRKTLDDARTFFAQSTSALEQGDLQRALTLARKASLLVSTLEEK